MQPGTFIRPAGKGYRYCYEVVKVVPRCSDSGEQWHCKRWGLSHDLQPVKDGGGHDLHYLSNLKLIRPGVWKDEWEHDTPSRWACCPLYYRAIDLRGQQDMFA